MGQAPSSASLVAQIEELAQRTDLSIDRIREALQGQVSRSVVGEIVKRVRDQQIET